MSFPLLITAQPTQLLVARNDTVRTGPLQPVKKNIVLNDDIPVGRYSWRLLTALNPTTQGVAAQQDDYFIFTPAAACRNTSFKLAYAITANNQHDTAEIVVVVSNYNNPVNVLPSDAHCTDDIQSGVTFKVHEKFTNTTQALDGFSMPLVGDINGDGKPDIIALGLGRNGNFTIGNGLSARAWYVHVFNGQSGERTWSINLGTEPSGSTLTSVTSLNHPGITTNIDESLDQFQLRYDPRYNSPGHLAIADLDNDGLGEIVVVECGNLGKIYALKPQVDSLRNITGFSVYWYGNNQGASYSYKTPVTGNHEIFGSGIPYIADLNADGIPEVIIYNKIFHGRTGQILCQLETLNNFNFPVASNISTIRDNYAYVGRRPRAAWSEDYVHCMSIADINNDGILDIVAGSKVYVMKNDNGVPALDYIIYGPSNIRTQQGPGEVGTYVADGFTSVADIDMDGSLDVIVLAPAVDGLNEATRNILYVWDPLHNPTTAKAAVYLYTRSTTGTMSFPFVGDINGRLDNYAANKRLPEICFNGGRFYTSHSSASNIAFHPLSAASLTAEGITGASSTRGFNYDPTNDVRGHVVGFTYHANPDGSTPLHQRLKLAWAMEHDDVSSSTGITMFDFDNDDIKELCYRDGKSVKVISPVLNTYISRTENTGAIRFEQGNIKSFTGFEAPVIADVDMDGSADIVTFVYPSSEADGQSKGYIYVYEHDPGSDKWAPCPPVWNQTIYFPLQINADLTVPAKPQPLLTPYNDRYGNTIYPYNGQWLQQPIVRDGTHYSPVAQKPDMILYNMTIRIESQTKAVLTLTIGNRGSTSVNSQTPITFYDGGTTGIDITGGATVIKTVQIGVDIFSGEKVTCTYELTGNFNNKLVWARLVDDATNFPATGYDECNVSDNVFSAIDCPNLIYYISTSTGEDILCDSTYIVLTATAVNQPGTPVYQWYRNDLPMPGETNRTLNTALAGDYKCYVIDSVCRGFSSVKTLFRDISVAHTDYVSVIEETPATVDVLANDDIYCTVTPVITLPPANGTALTTDDKIYYTPNNSFTGLDSLQYNIDNSYATVYFHVSPFPDNITNVHCFSNPPVSSWSIGPGQNVGSSITSLYQSAVVGDLDNDSYVDVLVPKEATGTSWQAGYQTNGINIYDTKTGLVKTITTALFATSDLGPVGIAKARASDNEAFIVVAAANGFLYAYNKAGQQKWRSNAKYASQPIPSGYSYQAGAVGFADFNGDGIAEIYIKDKIFDLQAGTLLLTLNDEISTICDLGTAVADFDHDGLQEMAIRGKVYKIHLTNQMGTAGNSSSLWRQVSNNPHPNSGLATILADFDLDGNLNILVHDKKWFYIWDPYTGQVNIDQIKGTNYEGMGCPTVGDIDNDGYPEIIYSGPLHITAWDIGKKSVATVKWRLTTGDVSGYTGLSLFDFNQDNFLEIVYRDEVRLRIINGSSTATVMTDLASIPCTSGTQGEYPVIADIDRDGQADIIITGGKDNASAPSAGFIRIFKASAGHTWAPARKVWNQYAYNSLGVNDDLSIPAAPINPATIFPGKDGQLGTIDDVRPFNAFLQQQTKLNKHGNPLWLTPHVVMIAAPSFHYYAAPDSMQIRISLTNDGSAALTAPFYITAYANTVAAANKLATGTYTVPLSVGDTLHLTLRITNMSAHQPLDSIILRLNDMGNATYEQLECNYTGNEIPRLASSLLMAQNDYIMTSNDTINIHPLVNDSIPASCRPLTAWGIIDGSGAPKHGTVAIKADSSLIYIPTANFTGIDSINYYIKCNADSSTAQIYIIINKPLAQNYTACADASITIGYAALPDVQYHWFTTATGNTPVAIGNTLTITKNTSTLQSYWVELHYKGLTSPRYQIDLMLSDNCGSTTPVGCMTTGTIIFKEDFGGNSPSDPHTKASGIPQVISYTYTPNLHIQSGYTISKTSEKYFYATWYKNIRDHTFPDDSKRGYMIAFDASKSAGQFYEHQIDNLCAGTKLYFSAWITSLLSITTSTHRANLIFILEDLRQNILAQYYTGNIPDNDPKWKNYGFGFTVPDGQTSIKLRIINNGAGSDGNDFVMDDIEIRLCAPTVQAGGKGRLDTALCTGNPISFNGDYTDDGTFGNELAWRWEHNTTGQLQVDSDWSTIAGTEGLTSNGYAASTYTINNTTPAHTGYYRMVVSRPATINAPKCKAASLAQHVRIDSLPATPVIQVATPVCAGEELLFSVPPLYTTCQWRDNNPNGNPAGTTTYIVKQTTGTHTQVIRVQNIFGCWSPYSAPATGVITKASIPSPVKITSLHANFTAATPTVTFEVAWPDSNRNCRHRADVWLFVDRLPEGADATTGWTRATLNGTPTVVSTAANSFTLVSGNRQGFWLHGSDRAYSASVTVPLTAMTRPFSWCAYAMDFPPNTTESDGYYNLHGATPFVINSDTLAAGIKSYDRGCITTLTDATASPGIAPIAPKIVTLVADPSTIQSGGSATIRVTAIRAAAYSYDDGATWTTSATRQVSPAATTTYKIRIKSLAGCTATANVTVHVN